MKKDFQIDKINIKHIAKEQAKYYHLIGRAIGCDLAHCLAMANANTNNFLTDVGAYNLERICDDKVCVEFYRKY